MERKIAIIIDSGSSLEKELIGKNMFLLPFYIHFKNESFKDNVDITSEEAYAKREKEGSMKTSIPSIGDIENLFGKIKSQGFTDVLAITISSGLSGIYNAMNLAKEDEKQLNVKIIDSKNVSYGEGLLGIFAQELIDENPSITLDELYEKVQGAVEYSKAFIYLDTLKYLIEGGRVGKVMGGIGTLLKIMPVITCNKDGVYETIAKVRSADKAIVELAKKAKEFIMENAPKKFYIALVYKKDEEVLRKMEEQLKDILPKAVKVIKSEMVNPVIGAHSGENAIGIGALCF